MDIFLYRNPHILLQLGIQHNVQTGCSSGIHFANGPSYGHIDGSYGRVYHCLVFSRHCTGCSHTSHTMVKG